MTTPVSTASSRLLIIVLYRTELTDAATWQSLTACREVLNETDKLVIWDNSPGPLSERSLIDNNGALPCPIDYQHTPENISLAAIYNRAFAANPGYDMLHIFDQDSSFGLAYFKAIAAAAVANPEVNLFVPLIRCNSLLISPGHFYLFKGKYWSKPKKGLVPAKNNVAIASGMAIRASYLKTFGGFEERLQLYGIDTNFMLRYARDNPYFYVADVGFEHDVAEHKAENREVKARRFADFKKASLINAALFSRPVQWLTRLFLWYRTLRF